MREDRYNSIRFFKDNLKSFKQSSKWVNGIFVEGFLVEGILVEDFGRKDNWSTGILATSINMVTTIKYL